LKFLRKLLGRHGLLDQMVTDRLASYGAALKSLGAIDKREVGRWLNNRVVDSHQPFRRRERAMLRFNQERALISRKSFKERRTAALNEWRQLCAA